MTGYRTTRRNGYQPAGMRVDVITLTGTTSGENGQKMVLDDDAETLIAVEHVYLPEGAAGPCRDCGEPAHDPGMVGLAVGDGLALLDAEQALVLANRLQRAASLVLESEEDTADIEREAARFGAPAVAPPRSSFKPGDVIAVPPEVIKVTGFRETSRLVIKQRRASQGKGTCKSCGTEIQPGDLYAASTEPTSGRCIRCVDGWPSAAATGTEEGS